MYEESDLAELVITSLAEDLGIDKAELTPNDAIAGSYMALLGIVDSVVPSEIVNNVDFLDMVINLSEDNERSCHTMSSRCQTNTRHCCSAVPQNHQPLTITVRSIIKIIQLLHSQEEIEVCW